MSNQRFQCVADFSIDGQHYVIGKLGNGAAHPARDGNGIRPVKSKPVGELSVGNDRFFVFEADGNGTGRVEPGNTGTAQGPDGKRATGCLPGRPRAGEQADCRRASDQQSHGIVILETNLSQAGRGKPDRNGFQVPQAYRETGEHESIGTTIQSCPADMIEMISEIEPTPSSF